MNARKRAMIWALSLVCASTLPAQVTSVSGTPTVDFIILRNTDPGIPLRNAGVISGTEQVELAGKVLKPGQDYSLDATSGVVYLFGSPKPGQSLIVRYRFVKGLVTNTASSTPGLGGFRFDFMPGMLNMTLGLGVADRLADGTVLTGNRVSFKNNFSFGQGGLKGLVAFTDGHKVDAKSGFEFQDTPQNAAATGKSQMILQSLSSSFLGGKSSFDYQDVGKNFTAFGSASDAGYSADQVAALQREKGLKRMGIGFDSLHLGKLTVSQNYKSIKDDLGSVNWQSFGLAEGKFALNYSSQRVGSTFARFQDLSEQDKVQLQREAGLNRSDLKGVAGALSFQSNLIQDGLQSISRQSFNLDTNKLKVAYGNRSVSNGFNRFGSLSEADQAQWARETGLRTQWLKVDSGKSSFSSFNVTEGNAKLKAADVSLGGNNWLVSHSERDVDATFDRLGSLAQTDVDNNAFAIAHMVGWGKDYQLRGDDRPGLLRSAGFNRRSNHLEYSPKGFSVVLNDYTVQSPTDKAGLQAVAISTPTTHLGYKHQDIGNSFSQIGALLEAERAILGPVSGLVRNDFNFDTKTSKTGTMAFAQLNAADAGGKLNRQSFNIKSANADVTFISRQVDAGFANAGSLLDPEAGLLATLRGFKQQDAHGSLQLSRNLHLDFQNQLNDSLTSQAGTRYDNDILRFNPDKNTVIEVQHSDTHQSNEAGLLVDSQLSRYLFSRSFGRYGKLTFGHESLKDEGSATTTLGYDKQLFSYQANLTPTTALQTDKTTTKFEDGTSEEITTQTVSTAISKRAGLSVTESAVNRTGTASDTQQRTYGAWVDLGGGMRLDYNTIRSLSGDQDTTGTTQTKLGLTQGQIGGWQATGTYTANEWDKQHTQATGGFALSNVKPLSIGAIRDLKFSLCSDTASDNTMWQRENRQMGLTFSLHKYNFGYKYQSQIDPTTQYRAVDRAFTFATDNSPGQKVRANLNYKIRTTPDQGITVIRNFNIEANLNKNWILSHQFITNPELPQGNVLLGTATQGTRQRKWKLDHSPSANFAFGGTFDELFNDDNKTMSRTWGLNATFNQAIGSPVTLFIGRETYQNGTTRTDSPRFSLRYDQMPGPNQQLSMFISNQTYVGTAVSVAQPGNWTIHVDWSVRF